MAYLAMVRGDEARARALVGGAAALRKRFGWRVPLHCADDHRATEELVGPVGDDVPTALDDVVAVAREVLADG